MRPLGAPGEIGAAVTPVVLFTDFACPFSWVAEEGLHRLEAEGEVRVEARALELHPAPAPLPGTPPEVEAARPLAEALGLALARPPVAVRTRKAHELALHAAAQGRGAQLRRALYAAYFRDGLDVGRIDVLGAVAREAGLDSGEARVVLGLDTHAAAVAGDGAEAARLGIAATPVMLLGPRGARVRVDGAFPLDELRRLLAAAHPR